MKQFYFTKLCLVLSFAVSAQGNLLHQDSLLSQIPRRYLSTVQAKANRMQHFIDRRTGKALREMDGLEKKLQKRLNKVDPKKAAQLFGPTATKISNLREKFISASKQTGIGDGYTDNYTDTLESSLKFLEGTYPSLLKGKDLSAVKTGIAALKGKMEISESIKTDLAERKQQLMLAVSGIVGCKKIMGKMSKNTGYYSQQVNGYKEMLHDHSKAEKKAIELLRNSNLYQDFLRKNPILAGLFNINMSEDPTQALQYLQGRAYVENRIQQSIGIDPAARQAVGQQMEQAVSIIDRAKSKLPGGSGSVGDLPEQKQNPMKTKRFWHRLEFGADLQSQRSNTLLPIMTDIALQAGYKFNSRAVAGIGIIGKVGWGKSISHITLTSEGIGLRSFATYKLKGIFHATSGLEYNRFMHINSAAELKDWNGWTISSLAGIKVVIGSKSKFNASMILLYDFNAVRSITQSSPLKLRYQYNF